LFKKIFFEQMTSTPKVISSIPGKSTYFFSYEKEVEDISLTNQPCKRSQTYLGFLKGTPLTYCGCRASFAFACLVLYYPHIKTSSYTK
jgi:hypothetical protein